MTISVFFKIVCVGLIILGAYFLFWRADRETTFIIVTLGAVAFFLSIRFEICRRQRQREQELQQK